MAVDLHVEAGQEYMRPSTVARMMDVSVDTVHVMARKGELKGVYFGSQIRIEIKSLQDYLASHQLNAQQDGPESDSLLLNYKDESTSEGVRT